jgi:hypothetical protein
LKRPSQTAGALVRQAVAAHGEEYGWHLALVREDDDGRSTAVAAADQLLERVRVLA